MPNSLKDIVFTDADISQEVLKIRVLTLLGVFIYIPWKYIFERFYPELIDPLPLRCIVSILCLVVFLYSFHSKAQPKKIRWSANVISYIIVAHMVYLLDLNDWQHSILRYGYFFTAFGIGTIFIRFSDYIYFALAATLAPLTLILFSRPLPSDFSIFALGNLTAFILLGITVKANINKNEKILLLAHEKSQNAKWISLGRMSAGMSHEINNPLTIIISKIKLLEKKLSQGEGLNKEQLELDLSMIAKATSRISRIVSGLKTYTQQSKETATMTVELSEIFQNVELLIEENLKSKGIKLNISKAPDVVITSKGSTISHALSCVLENAIDAVEESPLKQIDVLFKLIDDVVEIRVSDTGPGINENHRPYIMQPFFTTKPPGKGTGLGLSEALGIVQDNDGDLYLDPKEVKTTFVFRLKYQIAIQ